MSLRTITFFLVMGAVAATAGGHGSSRTAASAAATAAAAAPMPCLSPSNPSMTAVAGFDFSGVASAVFCVSSLVAGAAYEVRVSAPSWNPAHVRIALAADEASALDGAAHTSIGEKITLAAGAGHGVLAVRFERSGPAYEAAPSVPFDVRVDSLVDVGFGRVPRAAVDGLGAPLALAMLIIFSFVFFL